MVAEILLSLLDPTPWIVWLVCDRQGMWDVKRVNGGDTLAEAATPLATRWRGYLGLRLKRDPTAHDLYVVISAMSAEKCFHHVLMPAEFNWFAHNVDRMRGELRAHATTALSASVNEPFWGISQELCWFLTHSNDSRHTLSLHLKQYRSSPAYVELQSSTGGPGACKMSAVEFEVFSNSVNHIRSKFPPGILPLVEWAS
jgi:hypothetical protein